MTFERSLCSVGPVAALMISLSGLSAHGEPDDGIAAPRPGGTFERSPQADRDPNGTGSSSFFLLDDEAPPIDREETFARWSREHVRDPDSVKAVRLGPAFKAYSSLIPPVTDWMMCVEFNAIGSGGGYTGLTQYLMVMRDSDRDGRWKVTRVDRRSKGTWREHCIPFMKKGQG